MSGSGPSGSDTIGVGSSAAGMNPPRYCATPSAAAAIAPANPAMNDVHLREKRRDGPYASRR
jgi:hypothetical protein